jgi:hypothetical protein
MTGHAQRIRANWKIEKADDTPSANIVRTTALLT